MKNSVHFTKLTLNFRDRVKVGRHAQLFTLKLKRSSYVPKIEAQWLLPLQQRLNRFLGNLSMRHSNPVKNKVHKNRTGKLCQN